MIASHEKQMFSWRVRDWLEVIARDLSVRRLRKENQQMLPLRQANEALLPSDQQA